MPILTQKQLVNRLVLLPHGQIVLWNFVDGLTEGLFNRDDVCEFLLWWSKALPIVESVPSPLVKHDPLFVTLDLLKLEPTLWLAFDKSYPGLALLGAKPDFRLLCPRISARCIPPNGTLVTTLNTENFFTFLAANVKNELLGTCALDTSSDGKTIQTVIGGMQKSARADSLKTATHLGIPGGVLWFTTSESMDTLINNHDADGIRDCLGLVDIAHGIDLIAVEFNVSGLRTVTNGRPTIMDAGGHRRFKARADHVDNRNRKTWGQTADLARLESGEANVDGAPERISHPIPTTALSHVIVRPVGRTANTRSSSGSYDDNDFATRLADGRDKKFLKRFIFALL